MDKKELSFEDFYKSLSKTIIDQLDTVGVALVRVNDHAVGMFKAPDTLTGDKELFKESDTIVEEDFEGKVIDFKTPDTIN